MIRKGLKLFLVLLCMLAIFFFSSDSGDASTIKSDRLVIPICERIPIMKRLFSSHESCLDGVVIVVRKCAHFVLYFLLGVSLISFLSEWKISFKKVFFLILLIVFLYACSDEFHQLFVPDRTGSIFDIILDTFGGSCGAFLYFIIFLRNKQQKFDI